MIKTFSVFKCENGKVSYMGDFANAFLALCKGEQIRNESEASVEILELAHTMEGKNCTLLGESQVSI